MIGIFGKLNLFKINSYNVKFLDNSYEVELKKGGKNILLNEDNKKEYVKLVTKAKLVKEIFQ